MRLNVFATAAAAALLVGCGGEADAPPEAKAEKAGALTAGEYEVTTTVEALNSTDNTTPATKAVLTKDGDPPITHRACVAEDGKIAPEMFAEAGDKCGIENSYIRKGKMTMQLNCTREGEPGQVLQSIDGNFTADSFDARVNTGTYLMGTGDYSMTRKMTGKRVGDCPAAAEG